jgi:hypothetical protein
MQCLLNTTNITRKSYSLLDSSALSAKILIFTIDLLRILTNTVSVKHLIAFMECLSRLLLERKLMISSRPIFLLKNHTKLSFERYYFTYKVTQNYWIVRSKKSWRKVEQGSLWGYIWMEATQTHQACNLLNNLLANTQELCWVFTNESDIGSDNVDSWWLLTLN